MNTLEKLKIIICSLLILIFSLQSFADTKEEMRAWFGLFSRKPMTDSVIAHNEFQLRYNLDEGQMQQVVIRFGLLKQMSEKHELGALFAYVQSSQTKEYRPTIQHNYRPFDKFTSVLNLRSRLEFRDIENDDANSIRYRFMTYYRHKISSDTSAVFWEEVFFNLTHETWTGNRVFERNRFFLGARFENSYGGTEIGYLNQFVPRDSGNSMEHVIALYHYY